MPRRTAWPLLMWLSGTTMADIDNPSRSRALPARFCSVWYVSTAAGQHNTLGSSTKCLHISPRKYASPQSARGANTLQSNSVRLCAGG